MPDRSVWRIVANSRRSLLFLLTVVPAGWCTWTLWGAMPRGRSEWLEIGLCAFFAVLFAWILVGFWTAVAGLCLLARRGDAFSFARTLPTSDAGIDASARTALLFPVYNEDAYAVAARMRTVWRSLAGTGRSDLFDVFLLSDSDDADAVVAEEEAWRSLCADEGLFGRVFYRRRRRHVARKSGNVADFCRRWGSGYRYVVMFDADSLMTGRCLVDMVGAMEASPGVGILQTMPTLVNARTLLSRMQQFSAALYGPMLGAGLHFWAMGDAQYWGHNAIVRVGPFMRHCALPTLPGSPPLGGPIFSHDIVEAAFMCRAGYEVWLAANLDGSYEECPGTLLDELTRARRWCQGNMQHARLLCVHGLSRFTRALLMQGMMFYGSALLWLVYLLLSSWQAVVEVLDVPSYFPDTLVLFPTLPAVASERMLPLLLGTLAILLVPKILAMLVCMAGGRAGRFGGPGRLLLGVVGEMALSTLLAPVRMLAHGGFIVGTLLGRGIGWDPPDRDGHGTRWRDAWRFHGWHTLVGVVWGASMLAVNADFVLWLSPIVAGLVLSVPLSVWVSRPSGRRSGMFLSPAELDPPPELRLMLDERAAHPGPEAFPVPASGFVRAVSIPFVHRLHLAMMPGTRMTGAAGAASDALVAKAVRQGPDGLSKAERMALLNDGRALRALHEAVWRLPDGKEAAAWRLCAE